ncbi:MAG TPA: 50S ribosomal protein L17 [Candidatus Hydrothermia bacterium]|nr:50S ribosomal protein L17 [Candidatus Hydrothermae bacterium]MDD3648953.1 50S ribosomal protein L17 [Candidatus Hydrothermia bacterium]MDD5573180.1 50S ribosomal protein L17 [Candidatus Hydrothermia bacterium]HOK23194.1 50S ribosomal protein L17 [Candidatus Hydrothermia bacterium]HOL23898.1 50S ribosomal protein L17 [Candidatus Hydrothermia bacterium]
MRHLKRVKKLGMVKEHREAVIRNQVNALFIKGRIVTTLPKAKETKRIAEKLINIAKSNDLPAVRLVGRYVNDRKILERLFKEIAPLFSDRNGGYTRILRLPPRKGDNARMAILELLQKPQKSFENAKG